MAESIRGSDRRHRRRRRWRKRFALGSRVGVVGLVVFLLVVAFDSYLPASYTWYCSECTLHEFRTVHTLDLPFVGPISLMQGETKRRPAVADPLIPYLDPNGTCTHQWVCLGAGGKGFVREWRFTQRDPTLISVAWEPDFAEFVKENPDVLKRIRASLRKRESISSWLYDDYWQWKDDSQVGAE